jgi:hypothetical protein
MMMRSLMWIAILAGGAIAAGSALAAGDLAATGTPPEKIRSLVIYGDDPCPRSTGDEIVVCARVPESERYRVPKRLRKQPKHDVASTAWGVRGVQDLEYVSRTGRPNSCSPVGSFGQSGCTQQFLTQWRAEQNQAKEDENSVP